MRRRPFRRLRQVAVVALGLVASIAPRRLRAQNGIADQAALFLLLPVSARAVGMGQSMMAASGSGDAVWWNPAGIATVRRGDAALHHSQSVIGTSEALTVTAASSLLGVVALSANILDFGGDIPAVDNQGNVVGKILPRNLALVGTYATTIGRRVRAGVSYKLVQFRFDCEGLCPSLPTKQASTSALDGGVQFDLPTKLPITIGAAIRNVGVDLQINDSPQSDPLPTRLQIGATARYVIPKVYADDAELLVSADVIDDVGRHEELRVVCVHLGDHVARRRTDLQSRRKRVRLRTVVDLQVDPHVSDGRSDRDGQLRRKVELHAAVERAGGRLLGWERRAQPFAVEAKLDQLIGDARPHASSDRRGVSPYQCKVSGKDLPYHVTLIVHRGDVTAEVEDVGRERHDPEQRGSRRHRQRLAGSDDALGVV